MKFVKYKYIIALFIFGIILWFFSAWAKITHQAYAPTIVNISHIVIIASCVLAIIKVLSNKKDDSFLNQ